MCFSFSLVKDFSYMYLSPGLFGVLHIDIRHAFVIEQIYKCFNCSLSVKSMKFGMMIVFKALKKIGYGAIAKKSVKCEK